MLIVKIWCLPQSGEETLRELHKKLVVAAVNDERFRVNDEMDMLNLFPVDAMSLGLGTRILIEVFESSYEIQHSPQALNNLLTRFADVVRPMFPKARIHAVMPYAHKPVMLNFPSLE